MSHNPFAGWSEQQVAEHNQKVANGRYSIKPWQPPKPFTAKPSYLIGEFKEKENSIPLMAGTRKDVVKFTAKMTAIGAPRMTRADAWKKRPAVLRYFAFKEQLRSFVPVQECPDELHWKAWIPMPATWSKAKKVRINNRPHRQTPDIDNCTKAIFDSIFLEDKGIWAGSQAKYWCYEGAQRIEITLIYYRKDK